MSARLERILVVAFKYPPYAAVGGKRWAKLSKYLARQGVTLHVLSVHWPTTNPDALADVAGPHIHIHRIAALTPNRIHVRNPESLADRARNRVYRTWVANRPLGQDAALWGPAVVPSAAYLARTHDVQAIVTTGAPFMANYWMTRARPLLPRVPMIQEFRDPWADLPETTLASQGGVARVRKLERRVIDSADAIVTVTDGLSELIRAKAGDTPVHTIRNGYDPDDLPREPLTGPRPFRFIHGGNLYAGRQAPLRSFLRAVEEVAAEMPDLDLVFRGGFPDDVRSEFSHLEESGILKILPSIPGVAFMREVDESFVALQFNAPEFPYAASTKIYEYAAAQRPILSLNYGGDVDRLVNAHGLGWSVDAGSGDAIAVALRDVHAEWLRDPALSVQPSGFEQYRCDNIARAYSALLESLATPAGG